MKKRNLKPTQTAPVERPQAGSTSRDPLAMFAAGGVGASKIDEVCGREYEECYKNYGDELEYWKCQKEKGECETRELRKLPNEGWDPFSRED